MRFFSYGERAAAVDYRCTKRARGMLFVWRRASVRSVPRGFLRRVYGEVFYIGQRKQRMACVFV